jgi:glutaredoxin
MTTRAGAWLTPQRRSVLGLLVLMIVVSLASRWWGNSQQKAVGTQVAQAAAPGDIQMVSSTTCGICTRARLWFQQHEVRFYECFVEKDAACAARFQALMAPGTPVIVVHGKPLLGFDPQRVLKALQPS